jgi:hypothetical protein
MTKQPPAVLRPRLNAAANRAAAAAAEQKNSKPHAAPATTERASSTPTKPPTTKPKQTAQKHAHQITRETRHPEPPAAEEGQPTRADAVSHIDPSVIVATLRRRARDRELMALLTDEQVLGMWQGMVKSSTAAGTVGTADRAAMARAVGLPWFSPGKGTAEDAAGRLGAIAKRLEGAVVRLGAARRHGSDTDDADDLDESPEDGASEGVAHKMPDHARVPEGQGAGRSEADRPAAFDADMGGE